MNEIYLFMIVALVILAVTDLIVGVSNDAVNFLNSAIGSKAISFKTIMIVASIGVAMGSVFSSGMMEVARKGIFNPGEFFFDEIMIIFTAVMITDILLLDFFNSFGMPTSTTVSIVFELLGASVAMALIKIYSTDGVGLEDLVNYINTDKASQIIFGILLSVFFAFSVGVIVQWGSRVILSYNFEKKTPWTGALFGSFAFTAITYFIFVKGLKGTSYAEESFKILGETTIKNFLESKVITIILVSSIFWFVLSIGLISFAKVNIYKLIIAMGTFALALAFSGNDLVNFIGVPIAAYTAFNEWTASGISAESFSMEVLAEKVPTNNKLLFMAGMIMVLTLWFSTKYKSVVKTSIDLSRQGDIKERFRPNFLSRGFVRGIVAVSQTFQYILPRSWKSKIEKQFERPVIVLSKRKTHQLPAFDMVRASVNLTVAAVLISIATFYKLPLSTTYVTFMVAMGTSLADKAWGAESAVYRVAGVLNVIGGWFFTAVSAFIAATLATYLLSLNLKLMFPLLLVISFAFLFRNFVTHKKKIKQEKVEDQLSLAESSSIQGVIKESAANIASFIKREKRIYSNAIKGLSKRDFSMLKNNKKSIQKLSEEVDELRDNIFYFIKNLDDSSVIASGFYINILSYLQDITQSLEFIVKVINKHVKNNHKKLNISQIKELKQVEEVLEMLFNNTQEAFETMSFDRISDILNNKEIFEILSDKIQRQIERTRTEESSPKNTTLYFGLLLETKDLLNATMNLIQEYFEANQTSSDVV